MIDDSAIERAPRATLERLQLERCAESSRGSRNTSVGASPL